MTDPQVGELVELNRTVRTADDTRMVEGTICEVRACHRCQRDERDDVLYKLRTQNNIDLMVWLSDEPIRTLPLQRMQEAHLPPLPMIWIKEESRANHELWAGVLTPTSDCIAVQFVRTIPALGGGWRCEVYVNEQLTGVDHVRFADHATAERMVREHVLPALSL